MRELITQKTMLWLVKHAMQLIGDRLEQVLEHRAASSLKENFNGHAGHQCHAVEMVTLAARQIDFHRIETGIGLLIMSKIGETDETVPVTSGIVGRSSVENRKYARCPLRT